MKIHPYKYQISLSYESLLSDGINENKLIKNNIYI